MSDSTITNLPITVQLPTTIEETVTTPPGYATTEFWVTLVSTIIPNLITVLTIFKLVPNEVASTLSAALVAVIGGIITVFVALKYLKSRTDIKMKSLEIKSQERYYRSQLVKDKAELYFTMLDKGLVDKETVKREFLDK